MQWEAFNVYEVKMQHYAYRNMDIEASNHDYSNSEESYQEDRAFVNRLKKRHPRDYSVSDIQRLNRIAEKGLHARFNIDKAISQVKQEQTAAFENGTHLDGFRVGYIHKKTLELLEYIKGGA